MRKVTKISLIIAAIMAGIGVICLIASIAMGLTWGTFSDMVNEGKFSFGGDGDPFYSEMSEGSITTVEEVCNNLDIEFGAGTLKIYYDDVEQIQIQQEDVPGFKWYVEDRALHIEGGVKVGIHNSNGTLEVIIPRDMKFDEVDLEVGAGEADVNGLIASKMDIEVGAGEAKITNLDVQNLNSETGTGELYVELVGSEADYSYDVECGIGEIKINGNSLGGFGSKQNITNPGASRFLSLECGIGKVQVAFQE